MKITKKLSIIVIFLTTVLVLCVSVKKKWKGTDADYWSSIIHSDGFGYYSYLPCIFIYHSFDYDRYAKNMIAVKPGLQTNEILRSFPVGPGGKKINKYFAGTSILILPFFLLAFFLSYLFGYNLSGCSYFFHISVSVAAIFYLIAGLIFLRRLLKLYSISELNISLTLLVVVFGTNIFYYAVFEPSMSHVYSFGVTSIFLYHVKRYADTHTLKNLAWMSILISILFLIRPTNILAVLFIPFICGSLSGFSDFFMHMFRVRYFMLFPFLAVIIIFIQPLLWYLQTGSFFVWSYSGEFFHFNNPHILDILFSYKKGWFVYTPIMFFTILGALFIFWRRNKFRFISLLLFTAVVIYVLSSWWCWWYGGSFGNRAFIDFYPEFALVFALSMSCLMGYPARMLAGGIAFICIFLSLFQTDQYFNFMISPDDMNKPRYWNVFLKRENYYVGVYTFPDTSSYNFLSEIPIEKDLKGKNDSEPSTGIALNARDSLIVDNSNPLLIVYSTEVNKLPKENGLTLFVRLWEYMPDFNNRIVMNITLQNSKGDCYFKSVKPLQGYASTKNSWAEAYNLITLPEVADSAGILKVFIENHSSRVFIKDATVRFATSK